MKLIDPVTGQAVWDSNDPNAGPVPPAPEGRQWVRVDEPGDTMAPRLRAPGILDIGNGVTERLAFLNQTFNPVEGIGSAMRAGSRMMAPDQSYWDRIASLGEMASGVASIAAPIAAAKAIGVPAASAMMEGLLGASPTSQAATDMARGFVTDESGALRLYHGSPHDFDRFSMDKIGTGEGAQAYGHGLYFAENEGVARGYRDTLSKSNPYTAAGQYYKVDGETVRFPWNGGTYESRALAAKMIDDRHGDKARAAALAREAGASGDTTQDWDAVANEIEKIGLVERIDSVPGRMYEVEVNANPKDFIDFDAPWDAQPEAVKRHFAYLAKGERKPTGEDLARRMESNIYIREAAESGVPGIRYLDEGSRSKPYVVDLGYKGKPFEEGYFEPQFARSKEEAESIAREYQGKGYDANVRDIATRNYVIFDENLINIVRKYGIAGAATMLGVSAFDVEQALAENMSPSQWDQLVVGPQ